MIFDLLSLVDRLIIDECIGEYGSHLLLLVVDSIEWLVTFLISQYAPAIFLYFICLLMDIILLDRAQLIVLFVLVSRCNTTTFRRFLARSIRLVKSEHVFVHIRCLKFLRRFILVAVQKL